MPLFYTGDELGNIKSIRCSKSSEGAWSLESRILHENTQGDTGKTRAIQKLCLYSSHDRTLLTTARANGVLSVLSINADAGLDSIREWKETRFKPEQHFVGLTASEKGIYSCTSDGALGFSAIPTSASDESSDVVLHKAALPMRLCKWHLSPNSENFAYGGREVELSIWDSERAFAVHDTVAPDTTQKKRKRGDQLLPAEVWRAKNVPNDGLGLRQPVHITSLTYLHQSSGSQNHVITGSQLGNVRRYDTRAARRPVADWKEIGKVGGVNVVEQGMHEHELFVADHGCNLLALDLRNGRTAYSYHKIAGAITSISPSGCQMLGSTSRDRFFRLHSTFPLPEREGRQQENKGDTLGSLFMKSTPTVAVCDINDSNLRPQVAGQAQDAEDAEDVWAGMQDVDEIDDNIGERRIHRKRRTSP